MKKKIIFLVILLFIALLVWRFRPLEYSDIVKTEEIKGSFSVRTYNFEDEFQMENINLDERNEILEILNTSSYRPFFRNLWPWKWTFRDQRYDGNTVIINIVDNERGEYYRILLMNTRRINVYRSEEPERVYHIDNDEMKAKLIKYIRENGKKVE